MVHFIWHVMTERLFSLPLTKVGIHFGHVRMYATPYPISLIIFILDLGPSYTDKLLEFRWVQIAHLSKLIYFYTATKEISWMHLTMIIKLIISLNHDNTLWSCQNVCDALSYLLDNIYIRFGTKLYRQIVGIPMGTNCAPLVADLFLYCYERDFMDSLNHDNQAEVMFSTLPEKQETIAVALSNPFWTYNSFPGLVVCTHSGIKVAKKDKLVCAGCCRNNIV